MTTPRHDIAPELHGSPPSGSPHVRATAIGTHLLVVVSGEADLDTSHTLQDDLRAALADHPNSVAVELSRLTSCDGAALQAITDFCAETADAGVPTVIHGTPPVIGDSPGTTRASEHTATQPDRSATDHPPPTASSFRRDRGGPTSFPRLPRPWPVR